MKINWGKGIVIAIVLFMSFILYFVFKVQSDSKYDNELVVEQYYQKEQTFENDMMKEQNAQNLAENVLLTNEASNIKVTFPKDYDYSKITGKVSFYRPSSQKLDFEIPISLASPYLLIPKNNLADGRWDISIDWSYEGVNYLNKEIVNL
jgi:nitrogen fixation protein FixH